MFCEDNVDSGGHCVHFLVLVCPGKSYKMVVVQTE